MKQKNEPPEVIDLDATNYRVDRGDKGAPFWGDGIPRLIMFLVLVGVMLYLKTWIQPITDQTVNSVWLAIFGY